MIYTYYILPLTGSVWGWGDYIPPLTWSVTVGDRVGGWGEGQMRQLSFMVLLLEFF